MININVEQMTNLMGQLSAEERNVLIEGISAEAVVILHKLFPDNPIIQALDAIKNSQN